MSFKLFHAKERVWVFAISASGLGLISSMRINDMKGIQFVKSAWSIFGSELKVLVLRPLEGNNKGLNKERVLKTHTS